MNILFRNWLFYGSIIVVFLTNDSSSRNFTIPIGNYNIIERDLFFFPLMLGTLLNIKHIRSNIVPNIFSKYIIAIMMIYIMWMVLGIANSNEIKYIGYAMRQVIYILIYYPVMYYLKTTNNGLEKFKKLLVNLFFISIIFTVTLSIVFYGKTSMPYRDIFCWIDDPGSSGTFVRVLVAGALYFPLFFFLALTKFWTKHNKLILYSSIVCLLLTFTRSYWGGTILGLLFFSILPIFYKSSKIKKNTLMAFITIIIIIITIFHFLPNFETILTNRFLSYNDFESGSISYRLVESNSYMLKIRESILFGYGTGASVITTDPFDLKSFIRTPFSHNSYLLYLLNFGIIGTGIIMISYTSILKQLIKQFANKSNFIEKKYYLALGSIIISLLGLSFTASEISFAGGYFQLGIILAISDYLIFKMKLI